MKLETFLKIEAAVARATSGAWVDQAQDLAGTLDAALREGRFVDAHAAISAIDLGKVIEQSRGTLETLGTSALLFGASQASGNASKSLLMQDPEVRDILTPAIDQMKASVAELAEERIKLRLRRIVDLVEADGIDAPGLKKTEEADDLAQALLRATVGDGRATFDIQANLTTSRLISYGFLAEATARGITTYQVSEVLDTRTCPVCQYMHGKTFEVAQAFSRVDRALRTQDPNDLQSIAPWPRQDVESLDRLYQTLPADLQAQGLDAPPYHPLCRGVMQTVGTVTEEFPPGSKRWITEEGPATQAEQAGTPGAAAFANSPVKFENGVTDARLTKAEIFEHYGRVMDRNNLLDRNDIADAAVRSAVSDYIGEGHRTINAELRQGSLSSDIKPTVELIDSAMVPLQTDELVFRGVPSKTFGGRTELDDLVGSVITDLGYSSTTVAPARAAYFGGRFVEDTTIFRIRVPAGTKAIAADAWDYEVLLERGTKYRVLGVSDETLLIKDRRNEDVQQTVTFIDVEVVP